MRAVAVRQLRGTVELLEIPEPVPGPGELGVRIEAAGVNPFDWKIADGVFEGRRRHVFPLVLGVDGCGRVETVPSGTSRFKVGDRIAGSFLHVPVGVGTYAERTVVPETNCLVHVPEGLEPALAAALPTAGMTAWQSLALLGIPPGGRLLVVGASGGVGSLAVGFAKARGLRVIAVARASSHARLRELGAERVVEPDALSSGNGRNEWADASPDGLLDVVSAPDAFAKWAGVLRKGSTAVSTVGAARENPGVRAVSISMEPSVEDLRAILELAASGRVRVPIERRVRLEEVPAVIDEGRRGRLAGKTVVLP